jgi:hypothetical protein
MGLSKHIKFTHKMTSEHYYLKYIDPSADKCKVCDSSVKFKNIQLGFNVTCSHTCGGIHTRERLRNNTVKFNEFKMKVSAHRKLWWSEMSSEDRTTQIEKSKAAYNEYIQGLSEEERKEQFGWLNKLTINEKEQFLSVHLDNSLVKFWKGATTSEKQAVYDRRRQTSSINGNYPDPTNKDILRDYHYYKLEVRRLSEQTYKLFSNTINPNKYTRELGNSGYQLDHIFSISAGYIQKIPPKILASVHNLQMLL